MVWSLRLGKVVVKSVKDKVPERRSLERTHIRMISPVGCARQRVTQNHRLETTKRRPWEGRDLICGQLVPASHVKRREGSSMQHRQVEVLSQTRKCPRMSTLVYMKPEMGIPCYGSAAARFLNVNKSMHSR
jgi:hypothetical protein